jgi:hypothetical protein
MAAVESVLMAAEIQNLRLSGLSFGASEDAGAASAEDGSSCSTMGSRKARFSSEDEVRFSS